MLKRLKDFLSSQTGEESGADHDELQLALAALLVYAAHLDEELDGEEREIILGLLEEHFELDRAGALDLFEKAWEKATETTQLFGMTRVICDHYDADQRLEMLEMLWQVVYSDGRLHDHEASLMRRVAGLLHVSDRDSGVARKRALDRLGMNH